MNETEGKLDWRSSYSNSTHCTVLTLSLPFSSIRHQRLNSIFFLNFLSRCYFLFHLRFISRLSKWRDPHLLDIVTSQAKKYQESAVLSKDAFELSRRLSKGSYFKKSLIRKDFQKTFESLQLIKSSDLKATMETVTNRPVDQRQTLLEGFKNDAFNTGKM